MSQIDDLKTEAVKIIKIANRLRTAVREEREAKGGRAFRTVSAAELASSVALARGEPSPNDTVDEAFEEAIRFWAMRVAPLVTHEQWDEIVWHAVDAVPDFKGDVIRFFENRFEMLHLKDGTLCVP
ncbi:hypothetical protein [Pelagibacterium mangrovi]|uniref:hypothetical protein n=1 Tax=Pelagibacterium mangrovi TaxID=3119828 RepID=UPI002FC6F31F